MAIQGHRRQERLLLQAIQKADLRLGRTKAPEQHLFDLVHQQQSLFPGVHVRHGPHLVLNLQPALLGPDPQVVAEQGRASDLRGIIGNRQPQMEQGLGRVHPFVPAHLRPLVEYLVDGGAAHRVEHRHQAALIHKHPMVCRAMAQPVKAVHIGFDQLPLVYVQQVFPLIPAFQIHGQQGRILVLGVLDMGHLISGTDQDRVHGITPFSLALWSIPQSHRRWPPRFHPRWPWPRSHRCPGPPAPDRCRSGRWRRRRRPLLSRSRSYPRCPEPPP